MSMQFGEEVETVLHVKKRNRIEKLRPKLGRFWCGGCDAYLLSKGEKCPICGNRESKRRKK